MAARKSSRVHRKYKTKYRVTNWREYERGLRARAKIISHFGRRSIPSACVARRSYIQILFTPRALPDGRLGAQRETGCQAQPVVHNDTISPFSGNLFLREP